jgi:hypothetical protein
MVHAEGPVGRGIPRARTLAGQGVNHVAWPTLSGGSHGESKGRGLGKTGERGE